MGTNYSDMPTNSSILSLLALCVLSSYYLCVCAWITKKTSPIGITMVPTENNTTPTHRHRLVDA